MTFRLSLGRSAALSVSVLGAGLVLASTARIWPVRTLYNASASVPLGWYAVGPAHEVAVGDLVVAHPPSDAERLLVERGYLGSGVPILKFVRARAGQRVCRDGDAVTIDGAAVGTARESDSAGRELPRWSGCRLLGPGEVFLFNAAALGSFDSRYFGPVAIPSIIGKATPVWTW